MKLKSICPTCKGLGTIRDKVWGKRKCPKWNCVNGKVTISVKTDKEMNREFKREQEALSAQGKL